MNLDGIDFDCKPLTTLFADIIRLIHLLLSQVYLPLATTMENLMPLKFGVSMVIDMLR